MDQDAFRTILAAGSSSQARPSITIDDWKGKNKKKGKDAPTAPEFKPRNHKKAVEETYRDRATERRGGANDFAEVEKVLEEFERVNANTDADTIEEQRKMLGGDEKHTVLVKGLDFALLEQQKAKLYESQDVDDEMALEQVFQELSAPKKPTREELVANLKKSRSEGVTPVDKPLEIAKQQGKFRPIGAPADVKPKKRKVKGDEKDGDKKKKKRKLEDASKGVEEGASMEVDTDLPNHLPKESTPPRPKPRPRTPSPEVDVDADIFADAEEYHGFPSGSDSEPEGGETRSQPEAKASVRLPVVDTTARKNWFGDAKDEPPIPTSQVRRPHTEDRQAQMESEAGEIGEDEEETAKPVARLRGLASSTVPSIREILALDDAAEREEKRKAKKEKKKKKNPTEETKINREVKQLEQYVAKKPK